MNLDRMRLREAIRLMLSEEASVPGKVMKQTRQIEAAIRLIVHALQRGGRLFYVGAGTSGRLGVLDASECPPTFLTPPQMVQAIIAGGLEAFGRSIEGAEDDREAGAKALSCRRISRRDIVVGIAASGTTPFVWGALARAKSVGAATILLSFNPHLEIPRSARPTVRITPEIGPEVLTGSTRLKAGTATKLVLNLLSTLTMVQLGKVTGNLMTDLRPSNAKLRQRAVGIVRELSGATESAARLELERMGWNIRATITRLQTRRPALRRGNPQKRAAYRGS